jgi:hypothetical protein
MSSRNSTWNRVRIVVTHNGVKQLLSLLGATIILVTFIAKDARKDRLKELGDSIQNAENAYLIRASERRAYQELRDFETGFWDSWEGIHGKPTIVSDHDIHYRLLTLAMNSADETKSRLDELDRLNNKLPNGGKAQLVTAIRKECADILQSGTQLMGEIDKAQGRGSSVPSPTAAKLSTSFVDESNKRISHLYDKSDSVDGETDKANTEIWRLAENDLRTVEQRYEYWNYIYYVLYAVGWIITLLGTLIGQPEEKSVLEQLEEA